VAFLGIALLVGELTPTSRSANSIAATGVVAAYGLRAVGDALGEPDLSTLSLKSAWPSWVSPIGWGQQTFAFTRNSWWPLALSLGLAIAAATAALAVHARRELGESLLPERAGRATARATLRSPLGLAWRLHSPSVVGWSVGVGTFGLIVAFIGTAMANATFDNPQILAILRSLGHGSRQDLVSLFLSAIMVIVGLLAAASGLQAVLKLRDEEASGRAEFVLSASVSRTRWLLGTALVGAICATVVLLVTGLVAWLSFVAAGDANSGIRALVQALVQLPAALVFIGLGAMLMAVLPRISVSLTWGLFGLAAVIGIFGGLLQLPQRVMDISPLTHVPTVPVEHWTGVVGMVLVGAALLTAAIVILRRRELVS
jgi:ABC-2 type transport system permease protein